MGNATMATPPTNFTYHVHTSCILERKEVNLIQEGSSFEAGQGPGNQAS